MFTFSQYKLFGTLIRMSPVVKKLFLALVFTIAAQWNLTRAIIFENYLATPEIVIENDDEPYYLALTREASKHEPGFGSPYLKEWRDTESSYPIFGANLAGALTSFTGNIKASSILLDYLGVFLIGFFTLLIFTRIFGETVAGYGSSLLYLSLPSLFPVWSRPINPQVSYPLFLAGIWLAFQKEETWRQRIFLGIFLGAQVYSYPFHWTFTLPFIVLIDLVHAITNKKITWQTVNTYVVALMVAVPGLHAMYQFHTAPFAQESLARAGLISSRFPAGIPLQILTALVVSTLIWKERERIFRGTALRLSAGLITGIIVLNQGFITGKQLELNAHYKGIIQLFLVSGILWVIYHISFFEKKKLKLEYAVLAIALLLLGRGVALEAADNRFHHTTLNASASRELFQVIRSATSPDSVIDAPLDLQNELVIYTGRYVLFSPTQWLLRTPTEELLERATLTDPYATSTTNALLERERPLIGFYRLGPREKTHATNHFLRPIGFEQPLDQTLEHQWQERLDAFKREREQLSSDELIQNWKKYHVEWIVRPADTAPLPGTEHVWKNSTYALYRITNTPS